MPGVRRRDPPTKPRAPRDEHGGHVVVVVRCAEGLHLGVPRVEPTLPPLSLTLGPLAHLVFGWSRCLARRSPRLPPVTGAVGVAAGAAPGLWTPGRFRTAVSAPY